ncbi:FAD-binding oxidoreductase [Acetobacter thailandicus]|uniref:FAD-binding oxidoreductase n=1 Tax=Acetobacter thailandicus TaxID=1502842 RepID=UPI001BAC4567|nr:FAD-linked oxidase C-terminal domain-containing protein [Acetobacter thailandicus]MBS0986089.1 FAD-binding protein [Acetobacter thailandicus]MBS1004303.1 FAD-binding protein [Acetobacter thailandicus]
MSALEHVLTELAEIFGDRISRGEAVREHHAHGEGWQEGCLPGAVIFAESTEEVSAVLKACNEHSVPVVAFGGGTSLEGHVTPSETGISLDLSRMTRILEVNAEDMDCRVEAGVTRHTLNAYLRDSGLFFPVDPGGESTLGGMCATRASGTAAVRYGTMRENTLGLTVVLADGRVMRTGGRVRKSATGYDLTRLFVGSEGTLGIITEVQLRLHGQPEAVATAVCQFEKLEDAVNVAVTTMQLGLPVGRMELMDEVQMDACIRYSKMEGYDVLPTMFFEFHGAPAAVKEQVETMESVVDDHNGKGFLWSNNPENRNELWKARHNAFWACLAYRPNHRGLATDAVVPVSALTELITGSKRDIEESGLLAPIVGHVGDGNFHTVILVPPEPDGLERALELDRKIVGRALSLGGACSGEHGIGFGKKEFMEREHGSVALDVMRMMKKSFDPNNILNPGKMLPEVAG